MTRGEPPAGPPGWPDEPVDPFEAWLRGRPGPAPRAAFRALLRRRFLAGAGEGPAMASAPAGAGAGAADSPSRPGGSPRKEGVSSVETLLKRTPLAPPAREDFRAELRASFCRPDWGVQRAPGPRRAGAPAPRRRRRPGLLVRLAPALVGVAAAAALLVTVQLSRRARDAHWLVAGVDPTARVTLAGQPLDLVPGERFAGLHDAELVVVGGDLKVTLSDELRMEVLAGSRLRFVEEGSPAMHLSEGEVYLQTLDGYDGGLWVDTPETMVRVSGTTLGVLADPAGTCVCVVEGLVDVEEHRREDGAEVPSCTTHLVFRDASMGIKEMGFSADLDPDAPSTPPHIGRLLAFYSERWD